MTPALSVYLDLVRLIAAGLVMVYHMNFKPVTAGQLWRIASHGNESVIIFFVLSGFVISFVASRKERSASSYVVARVARIYSVAVIAVPVTLLADAIGTYLAPTMYHGLSFANQNTNWWDVIQCLTFVNEIWFNHIIIGTDGPYWSLGFEVWYYTIFGIMLFNKNLKLTLSVILMAVVGPKIILYFPIWLLGAATFRLIARSKAGGKPLLPPFGGSLLFVLTPVLYMALHRHQQIYVSVFGSNFALNRETALTWVYYAGVAILFAAHLVGFASMPDAAGRSLLRLAPIIRWAAGASFTLYLVHQPLIYCFAAASPWPLASLAHVLFVGLGTLVTVLLIAELGERRKRVWQIAIQRGLKLLRRKASRQSALTGDPM